MTHPHARVHLVERDPGGGAAWGPGGRFAAVCPTTDSGPCADVILPHVSVQLVDARTGETRVAEGLVFDIPAGPRWAADGSGLLTVADRFERDALLRARADDEIIVAAPELGIDPLDESPRSPGVPALAPTVGARTVSPGGDTLVASDRLRRPDGTVRAIGADLPDGSRLREASFADDGQSLWLLLQEDLDVPRWLAIAREDASGSIGMLPDAPSIRLPSAGDGRIAGVAPDDSMIVVSIVSDWAARGAKVAIVPTAGGPVQVLAGRLAGFIPSDLLR